MNWASIALSILVLTSGCIVHQPSTSGSTETPTPSTLERLNNSAKAPSIPEKPASGYDIDVQQLEEMTHRNINERRISNGLEPLKFSEPLSKVSQYKSADMAERDYFAHTGPNGTTQDELRSRYGTKCRKSAENIYKKYNKTVRENRTTESVVYHTDHLEDLDALAESVVTSLMNSPGHRENILSPNYDVEGIGVYIDENGTVFVTQEFCGY